MSTRMLAKTSPAVVATIMVMRPTSSIVAGLTRPLRARFLP